MKKLISILLTVAMLLSLCVVAIPASAAEKKATVAENHVHADFDGDGKTDAGAIAISSVSGFRGMQAGKKYYLTKDLVITTGADGVAPGKPVRSWLTDALYFDGCGYTIEFDKSATGATATSLFDGTEKGGLFIKNLNVTGVINAPENHAQHVSALTQAGGAAVVENVVSSVAITVNNIKSGCAVGGVWTKVDAGTLSTFKNVHFTGSITMTRSETVGGYGGVGGICGFSNKALEMIGCSNSGNIKVVLSIDEPTNGYNHGGIGGLVGIHNGDDKSSNSLTVKNCTNSGNVTVEPATANQNLINVHVGGIAGKVYKTGSASFENCINNGAVSYSSGGSVGWGSTGGIVGTFITITNSGTDPFNLQVKNCVNNAAITAVAGVGGIVGTAKQFTLNEEATGQINLSIIACKNVGNITGTGEGDNGNVATAGIIGDLDAAGSDTTLKFTVSDCINAGDITGKGWHAGGVIGRYQWSSATNAATVERCVNTGAIKLDRSPGNREDPWLDAAGIVAQATGGSDIAINDCINIGAISTAEATGLSTYPITNCVNTVVSGATTTTDLSYITESGNVYLAGSVKRDDEAYTAFSASTDAAAIITKINGFQDYSAMDKALVKSGLSKAYADFYASYTDAVNYKSTLVEAEYTKASWDALTSAISSAVVLVENSEIPAEADLVAAKKSIDGAKAGLAKIKLDALNAAIAAAGELVETDYSAGTWTAIQKALDTANAALTSRSQADIDAAATALSNAVSGATKINTSALKELLDAFKSYSEEYFTADSWAALVAAVEQANAALESRSQADIDAAAVALEAAMEALVDIDGEEDPDETEPEDTTGTDNSTTTGTDTSSGTSNNNKKNEEKKGCGSAIAASAVVLATVTVLGLGLKKKED